MQSGAHDFDFLFGRWNVTHRRLKQRLSGSSDWEEFHGTSATRPILGGLGNIEEHEIHLPSGSYLAIALRSFDLKTGHWAIWWLDQRSPHSLDVPVVGQFIDGIGIFDADDVLDGRPIKVRFQWNTRDADGMPKWQQSFSADGGGTWEPNWQMVFSRAN